MVVVATHEISNPLGKVYPEAFENTVMNRFYTKNKHKIVNIRSYSGFGIEYRLFFCALPFILKQQNSYSTNRIFQSPKLYIFQR